ncbi:hypothetical protein N657DRAFT_649571 [Parathielavia appendiculata]|uniref:Secreted protein n=1 Tax=Parathielavia appendiculata TaxID=2587402 RepID=A0AAN6TTJ1_9PEZI|nr:hypothetical protein N657DRAFT_649571 [Parathielavia appendiculata]
MLLVVPLSGCLVCMRSASVVCFGQIGVNMDASHPQTLHESTSKVPRVGRMPPEWKRLKCVQSGCACCWSYSLAGVVFFDGLA